MCTHNNSKCLMRFVEKYGKLLDMKKRQTHIRCLKNGVLNEKKCKTLQ